MFGIHKHLVIIFVLLLIITCVCSTEARRKKREKSKVKKIGAPKMNLRTLSTKFVELEAKLTELTEKIQRVDSAQGKFSDEPPCPMRRTPGFNHSAITGSCYRIEPVSNLMNWTDAQRYCSSLHPKSHLVAIETETEQNMLKAKWFNECGISSLSRFWTDGSKESHDDWYWMAGRNRVQLAYQNWITTTSHDDERFNCLAVYANEAYSWGDVACWAPHVVTCEIEV